MPRKTRKQKIASQKRKTIASQIPSTIEKVGNLDFEIKPKSVETDLQTQLTKKDLLKTIIITLFLVILELVIFKI